jgi:hypothetical protein
VRLLFCFPEAEAVKERDRAAEECSQLNQALKTSETGQQSLLDEQQRLLQELHAQKDKVSRGNELKDAAIEELKTVKQQCREVGAV